MHVTQTEAPVRKNAFGCIVGRVNRAPESWKVGETVDVVYVPADPGGVAA